MNRFSVTWLRLGICRVIGISVGLIIVGEATPLFGQMTATVPAPAAEGGIRVDGFLVDFEKLRAAVTAAPAEISASASLTPQLAEGSSWPDGVPRSMPAAASDLPAGNAAVVRTDGVSDPASATLPPPKELPPPMTSIPGTRGSQGGSGLSGVPSANRSAETLPAPPVMLGPSGHLAIDGVPLDPARIPVRMAGGCASCGAGVGGSGRLGCAGSRHCLPGREECEPFPAANFVERFLAGLYQVLACPDPCYEPYWDPLMNAAYFVDPVRPATQTRLRWDRGYNVRLPDRAEYFWARADGLGLGPRPYVGFKVSPRVDYHELMLYQEAARGSFGVFTELPYRNSVPVGATGGSGFGDMKFGTKSVLLDREMIQLTFQFTTSVPTGVAFRGLGVEHVSLEPSLLLAIKLTPWASVQGQISQWIPIGGDPGYAGGILHYHLSWNYTVWQPNSVVSIISTWELNGWSFQDGAYTDPVLGPNQPANNASYFSGGPGVRFCVTDNLDFGVGSAFAFSYPHWAATQFRLDFRYRY